MSIQQSSSQPGEEMSTYSVVVPVVANVNEHSAARAYQRLEAALRAAGFEPLDVWPFPAEGSGTVEVRPPFVAEAGTVADL